jgi:hypothetical protein
LVWTCFTRPTASGKSGRMTRGCSERTVSNLLIIASISRLLLIEVSFIDTQRCW